MAGLSREYGVRRVVRFCYRKSIFLLDAELRRWYKGDSCLKKVLGGRQEAALPTARARRARLQRTRHEGRRTLQRPLGWAGDCRRSTACGVSSDSASHATPERPAISARGYSRRRNVGWHGSFQKRVFFTKRTQLKNSEQLLYE